MEYNLDDNDKEMLKGVMMRSLGMMSYEMDANALTVPLDRLVQEYGSIEMRVKLMFKWALFAVLELKRADKDLSFVDKVEQMQELTLGDEELGFGIKDINLYEEIMFSLGTLSLGEIGEICIKTTALPTNQIFNADTKEQL